MKTIEACSTRFTRRESLLALLGAAAGLSACGGGGGDGPGTSPGTPLAAVGVGGTGAFSVGPINGFGSIIVNGVRYDDSRASITTDDGLSLSRSSLSLGMLVAVQGSAPANGLSTATAIVVGGELQGPISGAPNSAAKTFVVLGQTVQVTGNTFFSASLPNGFASLAAGTVVEVHGLADPANNSLRATYIERKTSPSEYKIQGLISGLNATTKEFSIGSIRLAYGSASDIRVTPANGALVRVRMQAANPAPTVWTVTRIRKPEDALSNNSDAEFTGQITAFSSVTRFSVNNIPVDATAATFPEGQAGIALGARVEVKGRLVNDVLQATRVKPEDDDEFEFELHGTASNPTTTAAGGSFLLRSSGGITVTVEWLTASTAFPRNGETSAIIQQGRLIEVKGVVTGNTRVAATRIKSED